MLASLFFRCSMACSSEQSRTNLTMTMSVSSNGLSSGTVKLWTLATPRRSRSKKSKKADLAATLINESAPSITINRTAGDHVEPRNLHCCHDQDRQTHLCATTFSQSKATRMEMESASVKKSTQNSPTWPGTGRSATGHATIPDPWKLNRPKCQLKGFALLLSLACFPAKHDQVVGIAECSETSILHIRHPTHGKGFPKYMKISSRKTSVACSGTEVCCLLLCRSNAGYWQWRLHL